MRRSCILLFGWFAAMSTVSPAAIDVDAMIQEALAAEGRLDSRRALELLLEAEKLRPSDPLVLQRIARQYSDLIVDLATEAEKRKYAGRALAYARRAVELDPKSAVNALSLAISHGKLGLYSDIRTKVASSRLVKEETERALALDPQYAWALHVLGRWHHEVSALSGVARLAVRLFHGGLPAASTAEAVRLLQRAVELEPGELAHHLELGFALQADGQIANARAAFARGLAMPSRAKHDESAKDRARAAMELLGD